MKFRDCEIIRRFILNLSWFWGEMRKLFNELVDPIHVFSPSAFLQQFKSSPNKIYCMLDLGQVRDGKRKIISSSTASFTLRIHLFPDKSSCWCLWTILPFAYLLRASLPRSIIIFNRKDANKSRSEMFGKLQRKKNWNSINFCAISRTKQEEEIKRTNWWTTCCAIARKKVAKKKV